MLSVKFTFGLTFSTSQTVLLIVAANIPLIPVNTIGFTGRLLIAAEVITFKQSHYFSLIEN